MSRIETKLEAPLHIELPFQEALQRYSAINIKDVEGMKEVGDEPKAPYPFVKWAGGKRSIISELKDRLPVKFNNYYEPFVGGGALFFEIYSTLKKAYLSDVNFYLIMAYTVIKKDPKALIELLKKHAKNNSDDYYYKVRAWHELQDPIEISARFIYLNKTCYNGLYRVNKKGEFNVPVGKYPNPNIISEENIMTCHKAFKNVQIEYKDFSEIKADKNDFVYFDPPYHPTNETSFTAYSKLDFTEKDQIKLAEFAIALHHKEVKVMLSNSNTKFIKDLYKSSIFKTKVVNAPRLVNCKGNGRNAVEELLITNY